MRRKEPAASSSGPTSMQLKMGLLRYGDLGSSLMREILVITGFMVVCLWIVLSFPVLGRVPISLYPQWISHRFYPFVMQRYLWVVHRGLGIGW